jgi:hypothetical protein
MKSVKSAACLVVLCAALGVGAGGITTAASVHSPNVRLRAGASTNWAGYATSGAPGAFTSVSASWTQPSVTCGPQTSYSAFWVGLDGDTTSTVEQIGTEADCVGGGAVYSSWFEMYPHRSYNTPLPVSPGHTYQASVVALDRGLFRLTLQDVTAGTAPFVTVEKLNQARLASAEAIVEAPSGGQVLPLANFGTVNFRNVTANNVTMASPPAEEISMVSPGGVTKAQPSDLSNKGGFSVAWAAA